MGQNVWNISAAATLFAGFCGTLLVLATSSGITLLRDPSMKVFYGSKRYRKVIYALGTSILTSGIGAVLWIGVESSTGDARRSVLGSVAMAVLALSGATFAENVVLAFDAFLVRSRRGWMFLVIQFQRVVTAVSGAYLVVIVSAARHDVAPGRPAWHALIRLAYVFSPWMLARWTEVTWRRTIRQDRSTRASRGYARVREWTWLPFAYVSILTGLYLVYFTVIWAIPASDGAQLANFFGHLAVFLVLVPVGIGFGLLELCPSASTMATLFPFTLSLTRSHDLPSHARNLERLNGSLGAGASGRKAQHVRGGSGQHYPRHQR
jgi:hypothetical protein